MMTNDDSTVPPPAPSANPDGVCLASDAPSTAAGDVLGLEQEMPCVRCQYDLRGLAASSLCPECATPIATSIAAFGWRGVDPVRVHQLRAGLLLQMASWVAGVLLSLLLVFLRLIHFDYFLYSSISFVDLLSMATALASWWAVQLIACPVSFPDRAAVDHPLARKLRWVNHVSLIAAFVSRFVIGQFTFLPGSVFRSYSTGVQILAAVHAWFLFQWLAHVAAQIGRPGVARLGRAVAWLCGGLIVAFAVWSRILGYLDVTGIFWWNQVPFLIVGGVVMIMLLGSLVTGFVNVFVLYRGLARLKRPVDPLRSRGALVPAEARAVVGVLRKLPHYTGYHGPSTPPPAR